MAAENNKQINNVGFVPYRLEVEEKPELSDFSKNILFANFFSKDGVDMVASSLYVPVIESYSVATEGRSLTYRNIHNPENTVTITKGENGWFGKKTINGEDVLFASGAEWHGFFAHLTLNGLSKGERCKFERLDSVLPNREVN